MMRMFQSPAFWRGVVHGLALCAPFALVWLALISVYVSSPLDWRSFGVGGFTVALVVASIRVAAELRDLFRLEG